MALTSSAEGWEERMVKFISARNYLAHSSKTTVRSGSLRNTIGKRAERQLASPKSSLNVSSIAPKPVRHPYPYCKLASASIVHELAHKLVRWSRNGRQSPLRLSRIGPKLLKRAAVDALNGPANLWPVVRALVGAAQLR